MAKQETQAQVSHAPNSIEAEHLHTRATLVAELQETQHDVTRLLHTMAPVQDWQPEPAEWSFRYIAAHLAAVEEECHLVRVQRIAAGNTPTIANYRDRGIDFSEQDLADSLDQWRNTRRTLLDFVAGLPPRALTYIGIHEKLGVVSLLDTLQEMVDQDRGHLRHIRRLIVAYHEDGPGQSGLDRASGIAAGHTEHGIAPLYTNHKHGAL